MTLDTQMTLALLQELLMAIRANDADGYKSWLALMGDSSPSKNTRIEDASLNSQEILS